MWYYLRERKVIKKVKSLRLFLLLLLFYFPCRQLFFVQSFSVKQIKKGDVEGVFHFVVAKLRNFYFYDLIFFLEILADDIKFVGNVCRPHNAFHAIIFKENTFLLAVEKFWIKASSVCLPDLQPTKKNCDVGLLKGKFSSSTNHVHYSPFSLATWLYS